MINADELRQCAGDLSVYRAFQDSFEVLIEEQLRKLTGTPGEWVVIPLHEREPKGFYLVSADLEGQRRGREVLDAFLGPTTAALASTRLGKLQLIDGQLMAAGARHLTYVRRVAEQQKLVDRVRTAVSTVTSNDARPRPTLVPHLHRLRDFRLALLQHNAAEASAALADLRLSGQLSAENLRFLTVELHGRLGRWSELRQLPYFRDLLKARRPRAINELLLEMIWQVDIAALGADRSLTEIAAEADLISQFGTVIGAVDVPGSALGRKVAVIAAATAGDERRLARILEATTLDERQDLDRLLARHEVTPPSVSLDANLHELLAGGQFSNVIHAYLENPEPGTSIAAVHAVLDSNDTEHAAAVLTEIERFRAAGRLPALTRRTKQDLDSLRGLIESTCSDWGAWLRRVAVGPWPDAERILRASHHDWPELTTLTAAEAERAAEDLLEAATVTNQERVVAALDLLCLAAARAAASPHLAQFCELVLDVLASQQNVSGPVRHAYLDLLGNILESGPSPERYANAVLGAGKLWAKIAAPSVVDWAIDLVDLLMDTSVPERGALISVVSAVLGQIRDFPAERLSLRQRTEIDHLAEHAGLPTTSAPVPTSGADTVWSNLAEREIGIYTLQTGAVGHFRERLQRMQVPKTVTVTGNSDKVATPTLRALVARADYMIVDTWHAAHAATDAIDEVLPRDQQLLPQGRGVSGYIRVLEDALSRQVMSSRGYPETS
ncbi:protein DpdD [Crossiella sp. CA-258035]|uniref:protein DpdD n=1 Tax=Crossiella sp. CA-258035 TaxID=2981138 RepID=UPI0024BBED3F|nr:protein DpdD [Crossiella sp. CA-258035]WHT23264.1 protein DpdD [Crossiella sp. CA-258035]